ncbi:hypothetical protein [Roseicyclus persicicus]|uniref:Aspartate carbamoyltransferase catalytic subunit n=1 Tax=Roseicyclus persicicus TaxID=2650661 RepID=A0A7X6H063_9RHOB|nr:hypothetical protein [Roseibacterium persicicum]NKX45602.1 hypothetical protein [Roseibacterium persicicum]
MTEALYVFAVNGDSAVRHTHLTRAQGETPDLPPLTDWLGAEVDTDEIEMFPVRDIAPISLTDYVTMAFAPEAIPAQAARRMNALKGSVLLVPERALAEEPAPGREATLIATLSLGAADHSADLPKAPVTPMPRPAPAAPPVARGGGQAWLWALAAAVAVLVLLMVVL